MKITRELIEKFNEAERQKHDCMKKYAISPNYEIKVCLDSKKFKKIIDSIGITLEQMQYLAKIDISMLDECKECGEMSTNCQPTNDDGTEFICFGCYNELYIG